MTDAGEEFYRYAVLMLREAELAETAIRHRLNESKGTVRCTAYAVRNARYIVPDFPLRYPKVHVVAMRLTRMSISSARITTLRSRRHLKINRR
jgi:DNA-binding transcriptional LysR family regulator